MTDPYMGDTLVPVLNGFTPRALFAYAFGSSASGTAMTNPLSDLDVAAYLDRKSASNELTHKLAFYSEISRAKQAKRY